MSPALEDPDLLLMLSAEHLVAKMSFFKAGGNAWFDKLDWLKGSATPASPNSLQLFLLPVTLLLGFCIGENYRGEEATAGGLRGCCLSRGPSNVPRLVTDPAGAGQP